MTPSAPAYRVSLLGKIFVAGVTGIMAGFHELPAQEHIPQSEVPGNYSGQFFGLTGRSGLRSGWNSIPDTAGTRISAMVALTTVYIPVSGDITESSTLALGVEIPYSRQTFRNNKEEESVHSGLGNISAAAKYGFTLYSETTSGWLPHKAKIDLIGKIRFPTPRTTGSHDIAHLQSRRGSTDFAFGIAFLTETEKYFMIHGHALYWVNTPAHDYKMGNLLHYEVSFIVAPLALEAEPLGTFLPKVGVMGMYSMMDDVMGEERNNSGGHVLALSIGMLSLWSYIQSLGTFWMADVSYQLPILQHVNGVQPGYNPSFTAAIRVFVR